MEREEKAVLLSGEGLAAFARSLSCVRKVSVRPESGRGEEGGWRETEEEYQERQAAWLQGLTQTKKPKHV